MASQSALRKGAWTAGILSAVFLTFGIGGTMVGDYIIKNHLHGDTPEKHDQFCRESFESAAKEDPGFTYTQQDIKGCAAEKHRGYLSAKKAHETLQAGSGAALAVLVPATIGLGFASRRKEP